MTNRNCKKCGKFMPNTRIYLGYKECTRCSRVEPYSAHIVYPHKTGGYVQPVDKDTKKHLQTLDRRAVKVGRKSSGGSNSWDRWLKEYKQKKRVSYQGNSPALQLECLLIHLLCPFLNTSCHFWHRVLMLFLSILEIPL